MRFFVSLITLTVLLGCGTLIAEDVVRFRGNNSQGLYNETGLKKSWPEEGLMPKWFSDDIGEGWSGIAKVKDRIYVNGLDPNDSKKEALVCLDLDGKKLWYKTLGSVWTAAYPQTRATPTYVVGEKPEDDRIVIYCGAGEIFCLAAKDGEILWQKDLAKTYETDFGNWGIAESVIAKDGVIYATVCGKKALAVALNLADGSPVWESEPNGDKVAYVTPTIYEGKLIVMTAKYVTGLDIKTGKQLWRDDYQSITGPVRMPGINCVTPLVKENKMFVTSGFQQGGVMFEILPDDKGIEKRWTNKALDTYYGGVVELDGKIYGGSQGEKWVCLDWETGETVYNEQWERLGKGATIVADGMLYLYEEKRGTVGLVKPGDKFDVVSSFAIDFGSKEHWAHPVISDGVLYIRHGNVLGAYDIKE